MLLTQIQEQVQEHPFFERIEKDLFRNPEIRSRVDIFKIEEEETTTLKITIKEEQISTHHLSSDPRRVVL